MIPRKERIVSTAAVVLVLALLVAGIVIGLILVGPT